MDTLDEQKSKAEITKIKAESLKIKSDTRSKFYSTTISVLSLLFALAPLAATLFILRESNIFNADSRLADANKILLEVQKFQLDTATARYKSDTANYNAQIRAKIRNIDSISKHLVAVSERNNAIALQNQRVKRDLAISDSILNARNNELTEKEKKDAEDRIEIANRKLAYSNDPSMQAAWSRAIGNIEDLYKPIRALNNSFSNKDNYGRYILTVDDFRRQFEFISHQYFELRDILRLSSVPVN